VAYAAAIASRFAASSYAWMPLDSLEGKPTRLRPRLATAFTEAKTRRTALPISPPANRSFARERLFAGRGWWVEVAQTLGGTAQTDQSWFGALSPGKLQLPRTEAPPQASVCLTTLHFGQKCKLGPSSLGP
jgi:hypothetical protein